MGLFFIAEKGQQNQNLMNTLAVKMFGPGGMFIK